jgi:Lrp/AsnC family transcriptional regulator, leucine-responsive regulatory protein
MDELDSRLLAELQQHGRASWAELGALLGLSAPAIAERARKLEERGVLRGYSAVIEPLAVERGLLAFIAVSLALPEHRDGFLRRVAELDSVQECHHVAGEDDYLLKARCRDTLELEQLVSVELKGLPGIVRTRTTIALSTAKETAYVPVAPPARKASGEWRRS